MGLPKAIQNRQRRGILQPRHAGLGPCPRCSAIPDRTRKAESECLHRVLQRPLPRRMSERALVLSLQQARVVIDAWRREYNEERPKKSLGRLTPAAYAKSLAQKSGKINPGL